jgi:hypothetical protein
MKPAVKSFNTLSYVHSRPTARTPKVKLWERTHSRELQYWRISWGKWNRPFSCRMEGLSTR